MKKAIIDCTAEEIIKWCKNQYDKGKCSKCPFNNESYCLGFYLDDSKGIEIEVTK